jgi:cobalamin biosynthesis protein CbiD
VSGSSIVGTASRPTGGNRNHVDVYLSGVVGVGLFTQDGVRVISGSDAAAV